MFQKYLGMNGKEVLHRLPSYLRGAVKQTILSHQAPRSFKYVDGRPNIVLVPGLFCSPSVFNKLGGEMEERINVLLPPPFPYTYSLLTNTCCIEQSTKILLVYLEDLRKQGIKCVSLVGHSLGGLIALKTALESDIDIHPDIDKLICIASPLRGSPVTQLLQFIPACKDMNITSNTIQELCEKHYMIDHMIISTKDSIVPCKYQTPYSTYTRIHHMVDYQHMDFYVGSKQQIEDTAELLCILMKR